MTSPSLEPLASKSEERRFLLKIVGVLVTLVLAFWLAVSWKQGADANRFPRVKLSDGTWLVARAVTTGTRHRLEIPYPLQMQFKRWQRSHQENHSSSTNRMVLWLTRENDKREMLDLEWFGRCEIVVSDDFTIPASQYHKQHVQQHSSSGSGTADSGYSDAKPVGATAKKHDIAVVRSEFPLVRPRDGKLRINVYDGTKQVVAVLDVPYPALPAAPSEDWQPEPLPATKTAGNVEVTLKGVQYRKYEGNHGLSVAPQIKVLHDGQPSETWNSGTELFDPLGNVARDWNCDLSPLESVWKLRLTLVQNANGRFLPEETKTLPPMPLAPAGQLVLHPGTHTINGAEIRLIGLVGTGPAEFTLPNSNAQFKSRDYAPGNRSSGMSSSCSGTRCDVEFSSGHPFLIAADSVVGSNNDTQLIIQDQDGAALPSAFRTSSQGMTFWFFEPKPTSTSVIFKFIVQQRRQVEFLIAPPKPEEIQKPK